MALQRAQRRFLPWWTVGKGTEMAQTKQERRSRLPVRSGPELQSAAYLTAREVASLLHVTTWALGRWRKDGDGPAFTRVGRNSVRYSRRAIQAYMRFREEDAQYKGSRNAKFQGRNFQPRKLGGG